MSAPHNTGVQRISFFQRLRLDKLSLRATALGAGALAKAAKAGSFGSQGRPKPPNRTTGIADGYTI